MTEVTIELDEVEENIVDTIKDDNVSVERFVQAVFNDGLFTTYRQWKAVEGDVSVEDA